MARRGCQTRKSPYGLLGVDPAPEEVRLWATLVALGMIGAPTIRGVWSQEPVRSPRSGSLTLITSAPRNAAQYLAQATDAVVTSGPDEVTVSAMGGKVVVRGRIPGECRSIRQRTPTGVGVAHQSEVHDFVAWSGAGTLAALLPRLPMSALTTARFVGDTMSVQLPWLRECAQRLSGPFHPPGIAVEVRPDAVRLTGPEGSISLTGENGPTYGRPPVDLTDLLNGKSRA